MAETRRKFDHDFRDGAVRLVRETGKPIAEGPRTVHVIAAPPTQPQPARRPKARL